MSVEGWGGHSGMDGKGSMGWNVVEVVGTGGKEGAGILCRRAGGNSTPQL